MAARLYLLLAFACSASVTATAQNGTDFRNAVEAVGPALVIIESSGDNSGATASGAMPDGFPQGNPNLRGFVPIDVFDSNGLRIGFAVSEDLLVAALVSDDRSDVSFVTADGTSHTGEVVARDHVTGLAAIRTETSSFPALALVTEPPAVGSPVLICGGRQGKVFYRASMIASDAGSFHPPFGFTQQLDVAFAPELTGSAVVGSDGALVGVVAFANGSALCIPAEHIRRLVEAASKPDPTDLFQGVLGVALAEPRKIQSVMGGTPAEEAGLISGDLISNVNGIRCDTLQDIMAAVAMSRGGNEITLEIVRGDETVEHKLKLKSVDPPAGRPGILQSIPRHSMPHWAPFRGPTAQRAGPMIDEDGLRRIIEELKESLGQPEN